MERFTTHTGLAVALDRQNIDTDQIIPKQFLKRIERTGYGEFLFYDWRFRSDGGLDPDFVLNLPRHSGASVLIAGSNFGCGSSREHAPWSLLDYGFRVIIAAGFADIFYNNSLKNGLLPVVLTADEMRDITARSNERMGYQLTVDLESQTVSDTESFSAKFEIDAFRKHCLANALDDIALTLQHESKIDDFERRIGLTPVVYTSRT
jgi:3-isopropylmalate/(R)-2-methylmalate dehydratase small subunit